MEINKIKITDGDLIYLTKAEANRDSLEKEMEAIDTWVKSKSLNNVMVMASTGDADSITVLSVNDAFEDVVIKGEE
jgi:hypothetical protein